MSFRKTYAEIEEMIGNTAMQAQMARDIVRRAGLRNGISTTEIGLLLVADGETPQSLAAAPSTTAISYATVLTNGGTFSFTEGSDTFSVSTSGLYRISTTLAMSAPSSDECLLNHAFVSEADERAVMESVHYLAPLAAPEPARVLLGGTGTLFLEAGESASHVFYATFGTPGDVLQDAEATRLYAERLP